MRDSSCGCFVNQTASLETFNRETGIDRMRFIACNRMREDMRGLWARGKLIPDVARARESFERALALSPRDSDILHNHGWLLCQQGEHARATQAFAQSLANPLYTQRASTLMAQGVCQLQAGDAEAAQASLSRALALDPTHPLTRYHLAQALLRRGDLGGARLQTQSLNESVFANAQTLWLGIRVERRARNAEAAARLAQRLEREHPQSQEFAAWQRGADDEIGRAHV